MSKEVLLTNYKEIIKEIEAQLIYIFYIHHFLNNKDSITSILFIIKCDKINIITNYIFNSIFY